MDKDDFKTCEQCLSLLTGIEIPRPAFAREKDFGYVLKREDAGILKSIAKQVSKGTPMTDRQHALVKRKLVAYDKQFKNDGIDILQSIENLQYPLRKIDRSHWIKVLDYQDQPLLGIRFPFNKKIIDRIEDLRKLKGFDHRKPFPPYENNTHYFPITAQNIFGLMKVAERFETKFSVHPEIQEVYDVLKEYEANKDNHVPGVYNYEVKNIPETAIKDLQDELGPCDYTNLPLYYERRLLYGLKHFDKEILEQTLNLCSQFTKEIIKRRDATILIPSDNYPFNMIVESILDLKRFPILIVLDDKDQSALDGLSITHQAFNGVVNKDDISVLFRLDNSKSEFNDYVRENKLNNSVAKNTKIVYISSNKLPKTLFKADWRPNCVISYGGRGLRFNNVTSYVQQFDLQIVYENASSNTYWNRSERKLINAIV
tara:strand:- start:560 stop:1843 length:1284 start_codon:yes stop_codon:yes gene_type:complete